MGDTGDMCSRYRDGQSRLVGGPECRLQGQVVLDMTRLCADSNVPPPRPLRGASKAEGRIDH